MTTRKLHVITHVHALGIGLACIAGCGTAAPAVPAGTPATAAAPALAVAAPTPAMAEPVFAPVAAAQSALVGSVVSRAPASIAGDLDALSQRLGLPIKLGQEILSSLASTPVGGKDAHFKDIWERLDGNTSFAAVWTLSQNASTSGFCAAMTFKDAASARRTLEDMGDAGPSHDGVFERHTSGGDVIWAAIKGRTLFISGSAEALLFAGGLAEATQATRFPGQVVLTAYPQNLVKASGKTREGLMSDLTSSMNEAMSQAGTKESPAFHHMVAAMIDVLANWAFDSSVARLFIDVGPGDGLLLRGELVPAAGSAFASLVGQRTPFAFDTRLPVRDDSTSVFAVGSFSTWFGPLSKMFEASGPAGKTLWRQSNKMFEVATGWSCTVDATQAGLSTLCSSPLKPGTQPKAALDAVVAVAQAQTAWEGELEGRKASAPKIKRSGDVVEIERKIENRDATAREVAKWMAGGNVARSAVTVKDGYLVQAVGHDARKSLERYGSGDGGKAAPLVTEALSRGKGDEGVASIDAISIALRILSQNKGNAGGPAAMIAMATQGISDLKAPFVFALRGGNSLSADFRIPLGSLQSIAKVVSGFMGAAGAGPAR